ncbi:hypothetical protein FCN23_09465 [Campylobacter jejuni]|nr:hypothetical protein FCN23_09465 [Campylobacter jejuni]
MKKADATTAKLQDQLSAAQTQQQQLILERDRGLSERDLARRRLALVTAAVSDPLPPLSGLSCCQRFCSSIVCKWGGSVGCETTA